MQRIPARVGDAVDDVDTPALIVDLDAFERNLDLMANAARGAVWRCARTRRRTSVRHRSLQIERGPSASAPKSTRRRRSSPPASATCS
jgi:D-serine deaminase-like pyridoxal phosphate-dependent protein